MATPQMIVLDQALAEVEAPQPDPASWANQLAGAARQLRAAPGRHRDTSPCPIDLPSASGGRALRFHERVLAMWHARLAFRCRRCHAGAHRLRRPTMARFASQEGSSS